MKKIVNCKLYDTEKAEPIHTWGYNRATAYSIREILYHTKKGAYFLHRKGGRLAEIGEEIVPLTFRKALKWLEEHNGDDVLEKRFANYIKIA